jgi:hypothetical protein
MDRARLVLDDAEAADSYRATCAASPINAAARAKCKYEPIFVAPDTAARLERLAAPIGLLDSARIVVLDSSAENGYPHTRATGLVCMPLSSVQLASDASLSETLRHEAVHIHQRQRPEAWGKKAKADGWTPIPPAQIPTRFAARCRLNPDTFKPQRWWAWEGHHVPLPLFYRDDSVTTLADVRIKWLDLRSLTLFSDPPPSFQVRYGPQPSQPEHPFELLAVEAAAAGIRSEAEIEGFIQTG